MTFDRTFARQIVLLAVKIVIILLLSNAGQTFFVYQNF
jgi:hypothetical protein